MSLPAIEAEGLVKRFGDRTVLDGVDLSVPKGSVLGLLGHNGAGKTTLVRVLTTLLRADGGRAFVAGYDVASQAGAVRSSIALAGQYAAIDDLLTGRQNLELVARLRHLSRPDARVRAAELLAELGLDDAADRRLTTYSGGMRRRLDLAACLVTRPSVLFLDEPTTGLDPASRLDLWAAVRGLVDEGVTVLLTTQYLEEADELADSIVVLAEGAVVAEGTSAELKARLGRERVVVDLGAGADWDRAVSVLGPLSTSPLELDERRLSITLGASDPLAALSRIAAELELTRVPVRHVALRSPSLDEVFLELAGR